jgi:hypothetical protein
MLRRSECLLSIDTVRELGLDLGCRLGRDGHWSFGLLRIGLGLALETSTGVNCNDV